MQRRQIGLPTYRMVTVDAEGFAVGEHPGLSEWIVSDESNGKPAHLHVAPLNEQSHHITSISAGFDQFVVGLLTLRIGSSKELSWFVHGSLHLPYPAPIECAVGAPLELTLLPPDDLKKTVRLSVVLTGYTR